MLTALASLTPSPLLSSPLFSSPLLSSTPLHSTLLTLLTYSTHCSILTPGGSPLADAQTASVALGGSVRRAGCVGGRRDAGCGYLSIRAQVARFPRYVTPPIASRYHTITCTITRSYYYMF